MMKKWLLLLLCGLLPFSVFAETGVSQRIWMEQLVYSLGWSFGLPDKPEDEDYLRLLSGVRRVRVEAEENRQRSDRVSVKTFNNFGSFSGTGWLSGISKPTQAHLKFTLPHAGLYHLSVKAYLAGHRLELAGESFEFDGRDRFVLVELGEVKLEAGETEILLDLPPGGGIDYVELSAPPLGPIAPAGGWRLEQPLDTDVVARTIVQALGLQGGLPLAGRRFSLEAETFEHPGLTSSTARHMGVPSGGEWLRSGNRPASLAFELSPPAAGCYSLHLWALGDAPLEVLIEDMFARKVGFESYLSERELGSIFLTPDELKLSVVVPPRGGIDRLELIERRSAAGDLKRLVGLPLDAKQLDERQVNDLLALVAGLAGLRQAVN
jgi:hypothetical protein